PIAIDVIHKQAPGCGQQQAMHPKAPGRHDIEGARPFSLNAPSKWGDKRKVVIVDQAITPVEQLDVAPRLHV
ncbi:MAG TPA: hypothetical protein VFR23_19390, partial [Jiangellaceae bacterium]|nr:hypothetical protein [Jiangellaceae bacterium]